MKSVQGELTRMSATGRGSAVGPENCPMDLVMWKSSVTLTEQFWLWVQVRMGREVGGSSVDNFFRRLCSKAEG